MPMTFIMSKNNNNYYNHNHNNDINSNNNDNNNVINDNDNIMIVSFTIFKIFLIVKTRLLLSIKYLKLPLVSPKLNIYLHKGFFRRAYKWRDSYPRGLVTGIEKAKQAKTVLIKIRFVFTFNLVKGAVSRNSAKLENYKMPVE